MMKRLLGILPLLLAIAGMSSRVIRADAAADAEPGFVSLFNGKNLEGWQMGPEQSWVVEEGEIRLRREFDGREHNTDYLWRKETFGDFVVKLEARFPERANSGIFLRTADLQDPVYSGIEVQVCNSFGRDQWGRGNCAGAIYDCVAPDSNTVKPAGEWNQYVITCRGPRISGRVERPADRRHGPRPLVGAAKKSGRVE